MRKTVWRSSNNLKPSRIWFFRLKAGPPVFTRTFLQTNSFKRIPYLWPTSFINNLVSHRPLRRGIPSRRKEHCDWSSKTWWDVPPDPALPFDDLSFLSLLTCLVNRATFYCGFFSFRRMQTQPTYLTPSACTLPWKPFVSELCCDSATCLELAIAPFERGVSHISTPVDVESVSKHY